MKTYETRTNEVLKKVAHKKLIKKRVAIFAPIITVFVALLAINLYLFVPYGNVKIKNSPYQQTIDFLSDKVNMYKNNYERIFADFNGVLYKNGVVMESDTAIESPAASEPRENAKNENYVENTDLQVQGVKEGDLLKESTNYFYYLSTKFDEQEVKEDGFYSYFYGYRHFQNAKLVLSIYKKGGLDTTLETSFTFSPNDQNVSYWSTKEMYLSDDCNTLYVVGDLSEPYSYYRSSYKCYAIALDISDFENITVKDQSLVCGSYVSSRMVDGRLLLITNYYIDYEQVDFEKPETFVPYVSNYQEITPVSPDNIVLPDNNNYSNYTVVTLFADDLKELGQAGLFGYSSTVYATRDHVYLTRSDTPYSSGLDLDTTDIVCVNYDKDGLKVLGKIRVDGTVNDQYSMDEYQGIFRVFVSTRTYETHEENHFGNVYTWRSVKDMNSALYCYDVTDWSMVAKVENFAPKDETVRSVRFMQDIAYVCTAVQSRDPVFKFDLSDINDISFVSTKEISGFSTSLAAFADDTLLGIGVDGNGDLKVELYRQDGEEVISVSSQIVHNCYYVNEYKSYLIKAEEGLIAVPAERYIADESGDTYNFAYYVFYYDQGELILADRIDFDSYYSHNARIALSDGFLYAFTDDEIKVVSADMQGKNLLEK
jgi:uncharacterized secreted protein with C-terminal beta-propeller domain